MRQHVEFIDKAIELCEYTKDFPDESKYRFELLAGEYASFKLIK